MQEYVNRLVRCGVAPDEAYHVCMDMVKDYGECELDAFIHSLECDAYGVPHVD